MILWEIICERINKRGPAAVAFLNAIYLPSRAKSTRLKPIKNLICLHSASATVRKVNWKPNLIAAKARLITYTARANIRIKSCHLNTAAASVTAIWHRSNLYLDHPPGRQ